MAWRVLSRLAAAATRARICLARGVEHRDQRFVLFAAAPRMLRRMAPGRATRLLVRGEGRPLHHAHAEAAWHRHGARQLPRLGHLQPAREARSVSLAIST